MSLPSSPPVVKNLVRDGLLLIGAAILATCIVSGAAPLIKSVKSLDQQASGQPLQPATISPAKLTPSMEARLARRAEKKRTADTAEAAVLGKEADPANDPGGDDAPTVATRPPADKPSAKPPRNSPNGDSPSEQDSGSDDSGAGAPPTTQAPGGGGQEPADPQAPARIPVNVNGEAGWQFSGTNDEGRQVALSGGALQLPGGFDSTTLQGGIGVAMTVKKSPIDELTDLSYRYEVARRGGADEPAVHVTVIGAVPGVDSKLDNGQANFVYKPTLNGGAGSRSGKVDALGAGNRWYSTGNVSTGAGSSAAPISFQQLAARNPNARIIQIAIDNGGGSGDSTSLSDATSIAIDDVTLGLLGRVDRFDFHA